ncbi:MAG: glucose 1-dehydrogenase [Rhodospirillales bacterium]|nr:glucose 1-dehydrogenase [Rhodospirillales bacterium]
MQRLQDKAAIITGGTTGLGFETARRFVAEGARVIITGTSEERLKAAAADLGSDVHWLVADVRRSGDLDRLAAFAGETFGSVDVVFANAGVGKFAPLEAVDEAFFDEQFDTNVKGLFFTVQKLLPLIANGSSIILNASAVNAKGVATGSVYFATKAAVRSLARTLAAELGPRSIRVNALSPGYVPTKFFARTGLPDEVRQGFETMIETGTPLGRVGRPDEIASAAVFLASDESSYVNAVDLVVDGGWMNI